MAQITIENSDNHVDSLWRSACNDYAKETGTAIDEEHFPRFSNPEDLSRQLDAENGQFQDFRTKRASLFHAMQMVLSPLENFGELISSAVSASFPPASCIMGAMMLLIRSARKVSESFDMLTDLFRKLGHFALRLESYKSMSLSEGMRTIIVKVMVNVLRVCAVSQKLLNHGSFRTRVTKWAKNVFMEDSSISSLLSELEELTNQEHKMVSAHGLDLTNQTLKNTAKLLERDDKRNDRERLDNLKKALRPVSASSQVFSSINESRMPGSGRWIEEEIRSWWYGPEPLLWIHGGPGVGKSYMASKIINDLAKAEEPAASAPIVASFFFKNNDIDLRSLNMALRTLAWQIAVEQPRFAEHAEEFCLKNHPGNSYAVWRNLLLEYFLEPSAESRPCCFVIDGIDEADTEEQEILFSLLETTHLREVESSAKAPFRVVFLGRNSIREILEEHSLEWIPEIEINDSQNRDDLHKYVSEKLNKTKLFRNAQSLQDDVIRDICAQAEGLWEWANLVIRSVTRCRTKEQIRKVVRTIPRGISAMLEAELQRLGKELSAQDATSDELPVELSDEEAETQQITATRTQQLSILLSLVVKARKPLSVGQLSLILEIVLGEEVLNLEDDLHKVYSSLFWLRPSENEGLEDGLQANEVVVTLRHSSFYEFFSSTVMAGPIRVDPDQAEAFFTHALLYTFWVRQESGEKKKVRLLLVYARKFLSSHLANTNSDKATSRNEISRLLRHLFTDEYKFSLKRDHWLIDKYQMLDDTRSTPFPYSTPSEVSEYWWNPQSRNTANERADMVLKWLTTDAKQLLENCARPSKVARDNCSFTVLFSRLAESFSRHWLAPKDIEFYDATPGTLCEMLFVYHQMAGLKTSESEEKILTLPVRPDYRMILALAEMQGIEKTPIWHAKVAQAMLHHRLFDSALQSFQLALDENTRNPVLSPQGIAVIHRDMSRCCTETGRYKEAFKHLSLAELPQKEDSLSSSADISKLIGTAKVAYYAGVRDTATATLDDAWEAILRLPSDSRNSYDFCLFLSCCLELHETHRIMPAFNLAYSDSQQTDSDEKGMHGFAAFLLRYSRMTRMWYRILQYVLMYDATNYMDLLVPMVEYLDSSSRNSGIRPGEAKYFLGTLMIEYGSASPGVRAWYDAALMATKPHDRYGKQYQLRSRSRLAGVCLYNPDTPFCEGNPLELDENDESSDICLFLASWLKDQGDFSNAQKALRGRVKKFIETQTFGNEDDDDFIQDRCLLGLLETFLIELESNDEDLNGALYLLKASFWMRSKEGQGYLQTESAPLSEDQSSISEQNGDTKDLSQMESANEASTETDDENLQLDFAYLLDYVSECAHCKRQVGQIYHWYLCRSCPFMKLCRRCYRDMQSSISNPEGVVHFQGICNPQHKFFYTGPPLQPDGIVPEGMMVLETANGERMTIRIKDWKTRLSEKWETAEFTFGGGLLSWCMTVLPEPQKSRWATFFKT